MVIVNKLLLSYFYKDTVKYKCIYIKHINKTGLAYVHIDWCVHTLVKVSIPAFCHNQANKLAVSYFKFMQTVDLETSSFLYFGNELLIASIVLS